MAVMGYLREERPIIKFCEKQRRQQFICTKSFLFVVKNGTPTDDELEILGEEIGEKWKKLGRRLAVSKARLMEIDHAHKQLSEKGFHMLQHWTQIEGSAATYQALLEALQHQLVERQDLVEKFCYVKGNRTYQCIRS